MSHRAAHLALRPHGMGFAEYGVGDSDLFVTGIKTMLARMP
jgi:hypothetical protein